MARSRKRGGGARMGAWAEPRPEHVAVFARQQLQSARLRRRTRGMSTYSSGVQGCGLWLFPLPACPGA